MARSPGLGRTGEILAPNEGIVVMARLWPLALAGIAAASCGWANAADLPPAPSLLAPEPAEAQFGGWYLRGDIGVGVNSTEPQLQTAPNLVAAAQTFSDTTLSPFGMIDFGAGYQFDTWFRVDATLEYRAGARLESGYALTDPASPTFGGPGQYGGFDRADVASFVGLINGYTNLGAWYGLSPFLGVGVGFADNKVSGFTDQDLGYADYSPLGPSGGHFANGSGTSFAWALMAGVDIDISPNLKLELGYRYPNYGSITTGGSNCLAGGNGSTANCSGGVASTIASRNRLASNEFRLGLIYLIGETPSRSPRTEDPPPPS
jgi:opacity protein-like surface antigen